MRVYFVGAGASKALFKSLPTAKDLTLKSLMEESSYEDSVYGVPQPEIRSLSQFSADHPSLIAKPIEEVLDNLDDDPSRTTVLSCVLRRLAIAKNGYPQEFQLWLEDIWENGHAVLTTNYDTVVERGIGNLGQKLGIRGGAPLGKMEESGLIDYGFPVEGDHIDRGFRPIRVFKLHGSISWSACTSKSCGWFERSLHAGRAEDALWGEFRCPQCQSPTEPVVVPPSRVKDCSRPFIQTIWERAKEVLKQADEIVFAGFSLDPSDQHIRDLLCDTFHQSTTKRVIVVDTGAEEVTNRYVGVYGPIVRRHNQSWKDYLVQAMQTPRTRQSRSRSGR